jgi:hypothetical protein
MENIEYINIINDLNNKNVWVPKRIELHLTSDQFIAFLKGYNPDWDMRYGILFNRNDSFFYTYRSGSVVGKYHFEKAGPDKYICVDMYDNPEKPDCMVVFDCIREACRVNNVDLDFNQFTKMYNKTEQMN